MAIDETYLEVPIKRLSVGVLTDIVRDQFLRDTPADPCDRWASEEKVEEILSALQKRDLVLVFNKADQSLALVESRLFDHHKKTLLESSGNWLPPPGLG
jgi:uncharacterized protein YheU (UPF0270 family)